MEEVRDEVKVIRVRKYCQCGGEMLPNGNVLCSYPPRYSHECNKCGAIDSYLDKYPKIEYESI